MEEDWVKASWGKVWNLHCTRLCTQYSPNLHLTLFCKPHPGSLGDSTMLTVTSLLPWQCVSVREKSGVFVCAQHCSARLRGEKARIGSIAVGSSFRPSYLATFLFLRRGPFFFNGQVMDLIIKVKIYKGWWRLKLKPVLEKHWRCKMLTVAFVHFTNLSCNFRLWHSLIFSL